MSNLLNIKDQSGNWIPIPVVTNGIKSITQNEDYTLTITLNDGTTYTTTSIKGEDGQDYILTENDKQEIAGLVDTPVDDVQINGQSIVTDGVANIPKANSSTHGVVKVNGNYGIGKMGDGSLTLMLAPEKELKDGTNMYNIIAPISQHISTFYGLAKASGDTTQSQSDNPVGQYTDEAKSAIQNMLDVPSNDDLDEVEEKVEQNTEDLLKAFPVETASGSIASFEDGADDIPLQSLVVDIEPVQDLHGYDSPWPAGGGKNKYNKDSDYYGQSLFWASSNGTLVSNSDYYASPKIPVKADTQYVRTSGTSANIFFDVNGDYLSTTFTGATFTTPSDAHFVAFNTANSVNHDTVQLEEGSSLSAYSPYSNECPITGWTGCEVVQTNKNLLIADNPLEPNANYFNGTTGTSNNTIIYSDIEKAYATKYTVSEQVSSGVSYSNHAKINATHESETRLFIAPKTATYTFYVEYKNIDTPYGIRFYTVSIDGTHTRKKDIAGAKDSVWKSDTVTVNLAKGEGISLIFYNHIYWRNMMIVEGDITDFVENVRRTYPVTFPTEVGTVYGAYVDVTGGELVVDRAIYTLDGSTLKFANVYNRGTKKAFGIAISGTYHTNTDSKLLISNMLTWTSDWYISMPDWTYGSVVGASSNHVFAFDDTVTTIEEANALLAKWNTEGNPLTVTLLLATPIHYSIASHEVKTLLGQNNIWADTGNVNVTYKADTELYINKQIPDVPVQDIQINGTSVVSDGVANVPMASANELGAVSVNGSYYGVSINPQDGGLYLSGATDSAIKAGNATYRVIFPSKQHIAAFYGLAKAAGDTTQSSSSNAVGTYTSEAQTAIKQMLGVKDDYDSLVVEVTGTDPVITGKASYRYNCGELYTLSITPPETGTMDIIFTSGATPTVLTLPNTVKMPDWWAGIETNTTYEMCITDGTYCGVMSWAT